MIWFLEFMGRDLILFFFGFFIFRVSWQVQYFVDLAMHISWQAQDFVDVEVQSWWQVQDFPRHQYRAMLPGSDRFQHDG